MLRNLIITTGLALAMVGGAAWYFNLFPTVGNGRAETKNLEGAVQVKIGGYLYPAAPLPNEALTPRLGGPDPIIVGCHLVALDVAAVASPHEGTILCHGTLIYQENPNAPGENPTVMVQQGRDKYEIKAYRPVEEGDVVVPGQGLVLINCARALNDLKAKHNKIKSAKAEYKAAEAALKEAEVRLDRFNVLLRTNPRAVSQEDKSAAEFVCNKCFYEAAAKKEAVESAETERDQAEIVLSEHEVRNTLASAAIVKTIYKKRGEAVKALEPVVQLQSLENLRAEGMVDVQFLGRLDDRAKVKVSIEPSQFDAPFRVLKGHRKEVTSVAVTNNPEPQVVSASEDSTVCVWGLRHSGPERVLFHEDQPVRVVACSPAGAKHNLCVSGCADGSLRIWDLADAKKPAIRLADQHHGAIAALAFSPDGNYFASGGEDNQICLWQTETAKKVYAFDAESGATNPHQGTITSLHFTPQCKLVSAARDNTIRVWELHENGVRMDPHVIFDRGGNVTALDVSRDGRWMFFDQNKTLQILSVADGRTVNLVQSPGASTSFEKLALFSPDASVILTAGAAEGRLQLWARSGANGRAYEVRQFATVERSEVTCATFSDNAGASPHGFAVSGTKDGNVYIWQVPTQDMLNQYRLEGLKLSLVERSLDAGTRQVRIGVKIHNPVDQQNPYGRLMPGRPVTVVIENQ